MSKVVIRRHKKAVTIINRLTRPEAVNERELKAIATGIVPGLIPAYFEEKRKETTVKCSVTTMISLREHFAGIISSKIFLSAVKKLILVIKSCESKHMNPNNLYLTMDSIFVEPKTKDVTCVFWPIVNNKNAKTPDNFFRELPFLVVFNKFEDNSQIKKYISFFSGSNSVSILSFEKMVLSLLGQVPDSRQVPSGSTNVEVQSISESQKKQSATNNVEYIPIESHAKNVQNKSGKMSSDSRGSSVSGFATRENDITADRSDEGKQFVGTSVLGVAPNTIGTTVLGQEELSKISYPTLTRQKSGEKINANNNRFVIGKDPTASDYCVNDNTAISRVHAEIINRSDRYYIVDKNSTNGTYINNQNIQPNIEYELNTNDIIRFADEDFIFEG